MNPRSFTILLLNFFLTSNSYGQFKWEPVDDTSFVGNVKVYAPRIGYAYYGKHLAEIGYGIYFGKEDLTIDDNKKLFLENIKKLSHSINACVEYTRINGQNVWAPKVSYVAGYFLLTFRSDFLWQTNNFKEGYLNTRLGMGIGLYNAGIFIMKEFKLKKNNPFEQNWGVSFTMFIWGGKQKYIPKEK